MGGGKRLHGPQCPDAGSCRELRGAKDKILQLTRELHCLRNKLMVEEGRRASVEQQLLTDPLTGASNRRGLEKRFLEECSKAERFKSRKLFMVFFDIDNFKKFNADYGENTGDAVLVDVVKVVESCLRRYDSLFRIGGEEFVVLLPEHRSLESACRTAERIRKRIEALKVASPKNGDMLGVTVSLGMARLGSGDSLDTLIDKANQAELEAKSTGKNRTFVYLGGEVLAVEGLLLSRQKPLKEEK